MSKETFFASLDVIVETVNNHPRKNPRPIDFSEVREEMWQAVAEGRETEREALEYARILAEVMTEISVAFFNAPANQTLH